MFLRKAFTLIELLVVIAIIAILAAILFPVFALAKAAAQSIVCVGNMKQVGTAVSLYLTDHDNRYFGAIEYEAIPGMAPQKPWIGYDNNNSPALGGFAGDVSQPAKNPIHPGSLDPYIKSLRVVRCPNKPIDSQTILALNGYVPEPSIYYTKNPKAENNEYGPATQTETLVDGYYTYTGVGEGELQDSALTLLAWEHVSFVPMCDFIQDKDWFMDPPVDKEQMDHFNAAHKNGSNSIWTDYHAKHVTYQALKRPWFSVRKDIFDP